MNVDRIVIDFAGTMVLVSLVLSQIHHVNWLWLTGFVGLNLLQSAFTGFFPLAIVLKKQGLHSGSAY